MSMRLLSATLCLFFVGALVANSADEKEAKAVCPVSGKEIVKEHFVSYKGAKVYFCCPGCPGGFEKNTAKFAAKANHQLVVTKQAKQEKCPLSGGPLNAEKTVKVGGVSVTFCCENCQGKVAKAEGDDQVNLVFADGPFGKGFKVGK